tara:strand:- start:260 stop:484 length:225 start_codon:yes stop_codon:yes gene_type:complete
MIGGLRQTSLVFLPDDFGAAPLVLGKAHFVETVARSTHRLGPVAGLLDPQQRGVSSVSPALGLQTDQPEEAASH